MTTTNNTITDHGNLLLTQNCRVVNQMKGGDGGKHPLNKIHKSHLKENFMMENQENVKTYLLFCVIEK